MDAINVQDLVVEYVAGKKKLRAVDGITFRVEEREIVGFLGVNGAGKTSTIKTLMGFQQPTGGTAQLFGQSIGFAGARGEVGFLPETAFYSPYLTPQETLRFYGELHGLGGMELTRRIGELLERVGLAAKVKTQNRMLSKGMLQRVGIAQALLARPRLLIMDEVSSGLDPIGRRDLRELLLQERESGTTIFFSSHHLSEAEMICDRVIVIHNGHLVAQQGVAQIQAGVTSLEDYFVSLVEGVPARAEAGAF